MSRKQQYDSEHDCDVCGALNAVYREYAYGRWRCSVCAAIKNSRHYMDKEEKEKREVFDRARALLRKIHGNDDT